MNTLILHVRFFATSAGNELVREWLKSSAIDRQAIGEDIKTVQLGWPLGMPLVRKISKGLVGNLCPFGWSYCSCIFYRGIQYDGTASWFY